MSESELTIDNWQRDMPLQTSTASSIMHLYASIDVCQTSVRQTAAVRQTQDSHTAAAGVEWIWMVNQSATITTHKFTRSLVLLTHNWLVSVVWPVVTGQWWGIHRTVGSVQSATKFWVDKCSWEWKCPKWWANTWWMSLIWPIWHDKMTFCSVFPSPSRFISSCHCNHQFPGYIPIICRRLGFDSNSNWYKLNHMTDCVSSAIWL